MWLKWLPWEYVVRRVARAHGFLDPIAIISHIREFSQPAEVNEPIELLRAGAVFHARGLINSRVIQHNMDWIWPYWVNRQFNPQSSEFIPGAVSLTHINFSVRNWTAVGLPDFAHYPIVDPRGLLMPFWDSWSIDAWIVTNEGKWLIPAQMQNVEQKLDMSDGLSVITRTQTEQLFLESKIRVELKDGKYICRLSLNGGAKFESWLIVSLRPYNPEGVSFIHSIEFDRRNRQWKINKKHNVFLSESPERHIVSDYHRGDVSLKLPFLEKEDEKIICNVGMATAAAIYRLNADSEKQVQVTIPLNGKKHKDFAGSSKWKEALEGYCKLNLPQDNFQFIYDAAIRAVVLHSPEEVYPGPFAYKRFWFRDAVIIIYAMLCAGMVKRAERLIDAFLHRQTAFGYFHSQQGEWDSNGQVLWLMNKFCQLSGAKKPKDRWIQPIIKGAKWIVRKRVSENSNPAVAGLLPAGFSAEHLGPNDFYYWDDFWCAAGLYAAARMLNDTEHSLKAQQFNQQGKEFFESIERSLSLCRERLGRAAMPASPNRRLDSGAIGSLAACYPTQVFRANDERVKDTVNFLMNKCIVKNGFYHEISHSGINPYLTLHLAQSLMRGGDIRFKDLIRGVAKLASPTGQWPEAVNPRTGGGCMGDGQHIWACAEWIIMMINSFVFEEDEKLIIGKGIFTEANISIGPVQTSWGPVSIAISRSGQQADISWEGQWFVNEPKIEICIPGFESVIIEEGKTSAQLKKRAEI